jgi:hypothetical protein
MTTEEIVKHSIKKYGKAYKRLGEYDRGDWEKEFDETMTYDNGRECISPSLVKYFIHQQIDKARQLTEDEQRLKNSGRRMYQEGFKDGRDSLLKIKSKPAFSVKN